MTTLSTLLSIVEAETSDKGKLALNAALNILSNSNIIAKSQDFVWLGGFARNPPARNLFSEHRRFAAAVNK